MHRPNDRMDEVAYWNRALSPEEINLLCHDTYNNSHSSGIPAYTNTYNPGSQIGAIGAFSNATHASMDIRCDSPQNLTAWQVEANGVNAMTSSFHGPHTSFVVTNVPLTNACTWAKVSLEGRAAVTEDGAGYSHWGGHQPATNQQLHFKVEPASQMSPGVFPVAPMTNTAYSYDAAGQLTQKSSTGGSPVVFSYDSARNMKQCVFDGGNRTNFYHYDHARRLVREVHTCTGIVEESSTFIYDGMDIVAKLDNLSGEMVYFTRGLGIAPGVGDVLGETHILGSLTQTYLYVQNHRGDTVALVTNGVGAATYDYDAWGHVASHTGADAWYTFSGKHFDSDAGLYYYGFRWYDAVAKRWTQPDPEGLAEGLDLYRFCQNDPINGVDVYGMMWCAANVGHAWLGMLEQAKDYMAVNTGIVWVDTAANTLNNTYIDWMGGKMAAGFLSQGEEWSDRYDYFKGCPANPNPWAGVFTGLTAIGDFAAVTPFIESFMQRDFTGQYQPWEIRWSKRIGAASSWILMGAVPVSRTQVGQAQLGWRGGEVTFRYPSTGKVDFRVNLTGHVGSFTGKAGGSWYRWLPHYHRRPGIDYHRPWQRGF